MLLAEAHARCEVVEVVSTHRDANAVGQGEGPWHELVEPLKLHREGIAAVEVHPELAAELAPRFNRLVIRYLAEVERQAGGAPHR